MKSPGNPVRWNPMWRNPVSAMGALALLAFAAGLAAAQQPAQQPAPAPDPNQYQGQASPPSDDTIQAAPPDQANPAQANPVLPKPSPSVPAQQPAPAAPPANIPPQSADSAAGSGTDNGTVQVAPPMAEATQPGLATRGSASDPDGDIVHPAPLPPGTLEEGARIRVRLLTELSSSLSEKGDPFRGRVDVDVLQDGQVLIPAGSEIVGKVVEASSGHFGGKGTLRLRPETVVLPNGSQFLLVAGVADTENSHTRVGREGTIEAGPRYKRDGIEYGGGVGVGVVAGAIVGGPAGALAGGLIGAGAVTVHLLMDHPQARLESGSVLLFTLSDRLSLVPPAAAGN
jgi:hypothetical protein